MIAIDNNGDFVTNGSGQLAQSQNPPWQNYISETRCLQGTYTPNEIFGRNPIIWQLGNTQNRIDDLIRIGETYVIVNSVTFNIALKKFNIT